MDQNKLLNIPSQILASIPDYIGLIENTLIPYKNHPTLTVDEICNEAKKEIRAMLRKAFEKFGGDYKIDFSLANGGRARHSPPLYLLDGSMVIRPAKGKYGGIETGFRWGITNRPQHKLDLGR